ncbi:Ionotropic receptor 41a1 [Blattella germanica]|nr:Ionotropic receptor 41a1 [Blattella germanica]
MIRFFLLVLAVLSRIFFVISRGKQNTIIHHQEELSELKPMILNIIERYFKNTRCICSITAGSHSVLEDFPMWFPTFSINIRNISYLYFNIDSEGSETINKFESIIMKAISEECTPFVVQVKNINGVIRAIDRASRRSITRYRKQYIYLPVNFEEPIEVRSIFSLTEMNNMPDTLLARFVNEPSSYIALSKPRTDEQINDAKCFMTFPCLEENIANTNDTMNAVQHGHAIELLTHKFVGRNPFSEIVLDVWINDSFLNYNDLFPDKISNLKGKHLKCSSMPYIPYTVFTENEQIYSGSELQIILELSKKINFTWEIVTDDHLWGTIWPNGTGNGVVGKVAGKQADFGIAGLYPWFSTYQWADFSHVHTTSSIVCMAPKPHMRPRWISLYLPLSQNLWSAVITALALISFTNYYLHKASAMYLVLIKCCKSVTDTSAFESFNTIINSFLTTLGMFFQQPPPNKVTVIGPLRLFILCVLIFCLFISSVYSGGLASILTIPRFESPIDTREELAESGLPWVNVHEAWVWSLLDSEDDVSKTLVRNFQIHSEEEMTKEATQGKTVFSLEKFNSGLYSIPEHINEETIQTLRVMKEELYGGHVILIAQKSSPYIKHLNELVDHLYESGILRYWESKVLREFLSQRLQIAVAQSVILNTQNGPTKLLTDHLQGAFIMLLLGISLASLSFLVEMVTAKCAS